MRALQTNDVFKAMRLVKALGIKEEFKLMALKVQKTKKMLDAKEVGLDIILTIMSNAGDAEAEVYDFLAGVLEVNKSTLPESDPMELIEKIKEWVKLNDSDKWKAFFDSLASLMK